jgi:preprotein translocase subunit SecE
MSKDDATWLNVAYIAFGALAAFFSFKAVELVGIQTNWAEYFEWYNLVATVIGIILGVVFTLVLRSDKDRHEYFLSAIAELRKVSWPSWNDVKRMTMIVCVVVAIFAVIVSVFDIFWARTLNLLI